MSRKIVQMKKESQEKETEVMGKYDLIRVIEISKCNDI